MADKRGARRVAEKAALAVLQKTMVSTAGDLAEAGEQRMSSEEDLVAARTRAAEHLERAKQEAAGMVADANAACGEAETDYAAKYAAATATGWTPATLEEMGYEAPDGRRARRGQRSRASDSSPLLDEPADSSTSLPAEQLV